MKKSTCLLFTLSASALLLCACGGDSPIPASSDSGVDSSASEVIDESSLSEATEPVESSSTPTDSTEISTIEDPQEYTITLVGSSDSVGVSVTAPSSALEGSTVTLDVTIEQGYFVEYIRLYAPTASEGGERVKEDASGAYSFTMPSENLTIYFKGVLGYTVHFESDHATAVLAEDSAPYDLFGPGYPVYVMKESVEEGYAFSGFTVEDDNGNSISTWNDRIDQVGFTMPTSNVTVTAHAVPLDSVFVEIADTYSTGYSIDMNDPQDDFALQIDIDGRITLTTDWADPYWTGIATYDDGVLSAELTHLTGDGYYTSATRHFEAVFHKDRDFVTAKLSDGTNVYNYLFARTSEAMVVKKMFVSEALDGGYVLKHRIAQVSAASGDFFTYTTPDRKQSFSFLHAFDAATGNEVHNLFKGGTYSLKTEGGVEVVSVSYDGRLITVSGLERGSYAVEGGSPLVLDGFGGYTMGENSGTYTVKDNKVTLSSGEVYLIDTDAMTATLQAKPTTAHPFSGKTYVTSESKPITIYEESYDDYVSNEFQFQIEFGLGEGEIEKIAFVRLGSPWTTVGSERTLTANLSYTYSEATGILNCTFDSSTARLSYNAEADTFLYSGSVWNSNQGDYTYNTSDLTLTLKA